MCIKYILLFPVIFASLYSFSSPWTIPLPDPLSDVTFIDAGKGIVHGDENEYKDAKITGNKRMYFMHTRNVISLENGQKLLKQGDHIIIHR